MARKILIAGNWKMYKSPEESVKLASKIYASLRSVRSDVNVVICPPFTALLSVREILLNSNVNLGAQNMHWEKEGAYTGEISILMLKEIGCRYVIIGHSERRQYFGETDEFINKKIKAACRYNIIPIVCVGEKLEERENNQAERVIKRQVRQAFSEVTEEDMKRMVIAYEPVWAIGTGKTATPKQAEEIHKYIRDLIDELYGGKVSASLRILYGGSVKSSNAKSLLRGENIDGALVGGASLDADDFSDIVKAGIDK
jgi:triosephosphate isomerase